MQLGLQLLVAIALFLGCALIHGTGMVFMGRLFSLEERELKKQRLAVREFKLMVPMAMWLFLLHGLEILLFALFYLGVGAVHSFEQALFESATAYTTLSHAELAGSQWRMVSAFEGLTGFLLIGWSAAMFVTDMEQVLRKRF